MATQPAHGTIERITQLIEAETDSKKLLQLYINRADQYYYLDCYQASLDDCFSALSAVSNISIPRSGVNVHASHAKETIALAFMKLDDKEKGLYWAAQAVEELPESETARFTLGTVFYLCEAYILAIDSFLAALRIAPHFREAKMKLGQCYREVCRVADAVAIFEEVFQADPLECDVILELIPALIVAYAIPAVIRQERILALCDTALSLSPSDDVTRKLSEYRKTACAGLWDPPQSLFS